MIDHFGPHHMTMTILVPPPPPTSPPSPEFLICCSISKRFGLRWQAFDLLSKTSYILWEVALIKACDATDNGRLVGRHLGLYQEIEITLKPREIVIFCA